jgi:hypothetical protein
MPSSDLGAVETLTALPNADAVFLYTGSCYAGPAVRMGGERELARAVLVRHVHLLRMIYTPSAALQGRTGWSNGKPIITGRAAMWGNGSSGQCLGAPSEWSGV